MILTVAERLVLLNSLPANGDLTTIRIVRKLREDLSFSEDEHKDLQFKTEETRVTWNPEAGTRIKKEVPVGEKALDVIKQSLQDLDRKKQLSEAHLPIWEKFVEVARPN